MRISTELSLKMGKKLVAHFFDLLQISMFLSMAIYIIPNKLNCIKNI